MSATTKSISNVEYESENITARVLLELENGNVCVNGLDEYGFVRRSVEIGNADTTDEAQKIAEQYGWISLSDWFDGDNCKLTDAIAKPVTVTFVGGAIPDEKAISYARKAGIDATSVVQQSVDEEAGKTYISFYVEEPRGWQW
jgi:hypothetical protein